MWIKLASIEIKYLIVHFHMLLLKVMRTQCYPRLACPLYRSHLMQLHEVAQAAPCLPFSGVTYPAICMQIHAPYACTALYKAG